MRRKSSVPIITKYQARQLLDLAELFYSDPENVKKYEEWQKTRKKKAPAKATAGSESL